MTPATDKQKTFLHRLGIPGHLSKRLSTHAAWNIINDLTKGADIPCDKKLKEQLAERGFEGFIADRISLAAAKSILACFSPEVCRCSKCGSMLLTDNS